MRRLLGVLTEDDAGPRAPQPGIGELDQLVDQVRTTGVPVGLEVDGDPGKAPFGSAACRLPDRAGGAHEHAQARRAQTSRRTSGSTVSTAASTLT